MRASHWNRACWLIAGISTIAGFALWIVPPRVSATAPSPVATDSFAPVVPPVIDPAVAEEIVMTNVFAASRTAPRERYLPPELAGDSAFGVMAEPASDVAMPVDAAVEGDVPVLFGTVVAPEGTRALLHLDALASSPRLYAPGEGDGGYTVVSIAPRSVVLRGPRGRITLRLDPEEDRP
jgi:hypothetical protein